MRISKEIVEFASGKDAEYQPERRSARSPGVTDEGRALLEQRARILPTVGDKHACHSELTPEAERARSIQERDAGGP